MFVFADVESGQVCPAPRHLAAQHAVSAILVSLTSRFASDWPRGMVTLLRASHLLIPKLCSAPYRVYYYHRSSTPSIESCPRLCADANPTPENIVSSAARAGRTGWPRQYPASFAPSLHSSPSAEPFATRAARTPPHLSTRHRNSLSSGSVKGRVLCGAVRLSSSVGRRRSCRRCRRGRLQ